MQPIVDMVHSVTGTIQGGIRTVVLGIVAIFALFFLFGLAATPIVTDKVADRADAYAAKAEALTEKALQAKIEQERAEMLAEDGWGYSAPSAPGYVETAQQIERRAAHEASAGGGWGEP